MGHSRSRKWPPCLASPCPTRRCQASPRHDALAFNDQLAAVLHRHKRAADAVREAPLPQIWNPRERRDRLQPARVWPIASHGRHCRRSAQVDAPQTRPLARRFLPAGPLHVRVHVRVDQHVLDRVGDAHVEPQRLERLHRRRVALRGPPFLAVAPEQVREVPERRVRLLPGSTPARPVPLRRRVNLRVVGFFVRQHPLEPVTGLGRPSAERDQPRARQLAEARS